MRIVIASRIYSPEPAAASYMLETLARRFRDAGHDVTVLTTIPPRGMGMQDISGVTVKRARVLRDSSGYVRGYLQYMSFDFPLFFRLLFGKRADLYFVEPPPTTGAVVRIALTVLRRPYFYDAADLWSDAATMATSSRLVLLLLRGVEIFALRGASHLFTISSGVADRIRELGVNTPTTVTGFGVDTEVFTYRAPTGAVEPPCFVYAGTYSEWHGADIFVEAFIRFSMTHPGFRLIFVGNGSDRPMLERMRDNAGLDTIEFWDPIDGPSLNTLLAVATASVASLKPGQGYDYAFTTKVYSSIAAGCPVVFTGVGPTVEFLERANAEHSAGVAVPYEVDAVVEALAAAADDPVSSSRRRELSEWSRAVFSLASVADSIVRDSVAAAAKR